MNFLWTCIIFITCIINILFRIWKNRRDYKNRNCSDLIGSSLRLNNRYNIIILYPLYYKDYDFMVHVCPVVLTCNKSNSTIVEHDNETVGVIQTEDTRSEFPSRHFHPSIIKWLNFVLTSHNYILIINFEYNKYKWNFILYIIQPVFRSMIIGEKHITYLATPILRFTTTTRMIGILWLE